MIIAVDFDGTCVTHDFPKVGDDIGAVPVLKKLAECGHQIILYTMRSSGQKYPHVMDEAINWFKDNGIPLLGANENPGQKDWTHSPKVYAHMYIDDAALGIPLVYGVHERPYVDWGKVAEMLERKGIFSPLNDM